MNCANHLSHCRRACDAANRQKREPTKLLPATGKSSAAGSISPYPMNSTKDITHHQAIREAITTSAAGIERITSSAQSENTKLLPGSGESEGAGSISPYPMNSKTHNPRLHAGRRSTAASSTPTAMPATSSRAQNKQAGRRSTPAPGVLIDMNALESGLLNLLREASKS